MTDQEIIDAAVEKAMLVLPEVVGNLITQHVALSKINKEFYSDHPEFKDKKDIVASVIEMVEGENPLMDYKELLAKSVPKIRERLRTVENLDTKAIDVEVKKDFNGMI
jgi:predicted RNA-binding protein with EMAP domain